MDVDLFRGAVGEAEVVEAVPAKATVTFGDVGRD
jgi:hypothetical protein